MHLSPVTLSSHNSTNNEQYFHLNDTKKTLSSKNIFSFAEKYNNNSHYKVSSPPQFENSIIQNISRKQYFNYDSFIPYTNLSYNFLPYKVNSRYNYYQPISNSIYNQSLAKVGNKDKEKEKYIESEYKKRLEFSRKVHFKIKEPEYKLIINHKIGLKNVGNTCYLNCSLQILTHTEPFIKELILLKHIIDHNTPNTKLFYSLCEQLINNKSDKYNNISLEPNEILKSFTEMHGEFFGPSQHDFQDFLIEYLNDFNKELNTVKNNIEKDIIYEGTNKKELSDEYYEFQKEKDNSIVTSTFYGQLVYIFVCNNCQSANYSFERFINIPLEIQENRILKITIDELLDEYFKRDILIFVPKCVNCKLKRMNIKFTKFSRLPQILTLFIKRFNQKTEKKNNIDVLFKESLDLNRFIDKECLYGSNYEYELYGICCHLGTYKFGHFFSYIKIESDWYEFNDSLITKIGTINIVQPSTVYSLFYKKK